MEPDHKLSPRAPSSIESGEQVCGVDKRLVEDFLELILNNYRKTDEATAFLEHRVGVSNVHAFTNVRDVLSHLCTMLDKNTPPEKKRDQLNNAEEHLRRAILEPYEVGFSKLIAEFKKVYEDYKRNVIPVRERHISLNSAPTLVMVDARLKEIAELARRGRTAKGRNLWTAEWEAGVASFVDAFDKVAALKAELEDYCYKYDRIKSDEGVAKETAQLRSDLATARSELATESRRSSRLSKISIAATIITFILAIILTIVLSR